MPFLLEESGMFLLCICMKYASKELKMCLMFIQNKLSLSDVVVWGTLYPLLAQSSQVKGCFNVLFIIECIKTQSYRQFVQLWLLHKFV